MDSRNILLVEDNEDDESLTLHALKKNHLNFDVTIVRDGEEAMNFLFGTGPNAGQSQLPTIHLVLLDLKIPKLNGLEVLRKIREDARTRKLPVVVFSSSSEMSDITASYQLGANSYIRKPVDFAQFSETVGLIGLYWLKQNIPPPQTRAAAT
jgi:CheY-like chemotaxis protein